MSTPFWPPKIFLKLQLDGHRNGASVDQDAVADVRMMLQDLSQDVVAPAALPAPSFLQVAAKTAVVPGDGARRFRIELPKVEQRDINALVAELGLLGRVSETPTRRWTQRDHRHHA